MLTASLILAINQIALAEGLALGKSLGIDPLLLHNVINSSSGESPSGTAGLMRHIVGASGLTVRPVMVIACEHAAGRSAEQPRISRVLGRLSKSVDAQGERSRPIRTLCFSRAGR